MLVLNKHGQMLYDGVASSIRDHLLLKVDRVALVSDGVLLAELHERWRGQQQILTVVRDILMYMVRGAGRARAARARAGRVTAARTGLVNRRARP